MEGGCSKGRGVGRRQRESEANLRRYAPPPSRGRRENAAFPASSFRAEARNLFRSRSGKSCEGSGERETPYASCDWGSRCFMQMDLRRKTANGKRKRSLGCARDDETRKRFPPIPFQSRAEANLCPFGAPLSRGRREKRQNRYPFPWKEEEEVKTISPLPVEGGCPKGRGLAEGERERSQPPALRATSFQRKEGEKVKNLSPLSLSGAVLYSYAALCRCPFNAPQIFVFQRSLP